MEGDSTYHHPNFSSGNQENPTQGKGKLFWQIHSVGGNQITAMSGAGIHR